MDADIFFQSLVLLHFYDRENRGRNQGIVHGIYFDLLVEWLTDLTVQAAFWEMGRERDSAESHFLEPDICTARRESESSEPNPASQD